MFIIDIDNQTVRAHVDDEHGFVLCLFSRPIVGLVWHEQLDLSSRT